MMDNDQINWCDYYLNPTNTENFGSCTGNGEEIFQGSASSSETLPLQPCGPQAGESTEQLLSDNQGIFSTTNMPDGSLYNTDEAWDSTHSNATPVNMSLSREFLPWKLESLNSDCWLSTDPDPSNDFHGAGAVGNFCADVGKASLGLGQKVVFNPPAQEVIVRPPLNYSTNPVVYRVDDKVIRVAGSTNEGLSHKKVYNPGIGVWECTENFKFKLPAPFGLNEYPNCTYYKDSEDREFLCCIGIPDPKGTEEVIMYDLKKEKWVQSSIKRCIPLVRSHELNVVSRLITIQIVECGGSIFVCSEQECGTDVYSCISKLNLDHSFGDPGMWEEIYMSHKTTGGPDFQEFREYPEFTDVPLSATMVKCGGNSTFVFSEQESGQKVFICIQKLKRDGSGDSTWEEFMRRMRKRHRSPNSNAELITAFLKAKVEALGAVSKGKADWDFISERLERDGYNKGPRACEDLWTTLLKRLTDIQVYVQSNNILGPSSSWDIWNMNENERADNKLPKVFTLEWHQMTETIHGKKPRKKTRGKTKQVDVNASTSLLNDSPVTSANSSGLIDANSPSLLPLPTSTTLLTMGQGDEQQIEDKRLGRTDLTSEVSSLFNFLLQGRQNLTNKQITQTKAEALKIVKSKLELDILKEKNNFARACADRRPSKSRKTGA